MVNDDECINQKNQSKLSLILFPENLPGF
jgi:hypothetical protein